MSVGTICVREIDTADPDETIRAAAGRLRDRCVGSLLVCDGRQRPIGILTDRDIATRVVAENLDPDETSVSEVMSVAPKCVSEETPIEAALCAMRLGPHRRLPVTNERDELIGVVCLDDVLDLLAQEFREIGGLLRREGPASLLGS